MNKLMNICWKLMALAAVLCALFMLTACGRENGGISQSGRQVRIEHGIYYYDQGYVISGGWMYEMTIASDHQLNELDQLADALVLDWPGEDFLLGQGYRLIWKDASGSVTKEMLLIDGETVSMEGILYDVQNGQALYDWIEALEIDEQSVE